MQIHINTDHSIAGREAQAARVGSVVENSMIRLSDHITRVEVHLSDENGAKSGRNDKRCVMEAHLHGREPVTVSHHAATLDHAVGGAAGRLRKMVESSIKRVNELANRTTEPPQPRPNLPVL